MINSEAVFLSQIVNLTTLGLTPLTVLKAYENQGNITEHIVVEQYGIWNFGPISWPFYASIGKPSRALPAKILPW